MTQEEKTSLCENIVKKGISFYKENLKQFSTYEKWKQLSEIYSFCFGEQMHKEEELGYKIYEPVWLSDPLPQSSASLSCLLHCPLF